jgi:hypothetical protein
MIDLERRLRRAFSIMAAEESLAEGLDKDSAMAMLDWADVIAKQFVLKTSQMEDAVAEDYLAPYSSALHKMMRAIGHWALETDYDAREEWWNRIEQNGKTLYTDAFILPHMDTVAARLSTGATTREMIEFVQRLIEAQRAQG